MLSSTFNVPIPSPARIVLCAVLLRLALLAVAYPVVDRVIREDTHTYVDLAKTLLSQGRFAEAPDLPPDTFRTPGYPAFLAASFAASGSSLWFALIAQVFLSAATLGATFVLVSEAASPRTASLATLILAASPASTFHSVLVLSDSVFAFAFLLASLALWRGVARGSPGYCALGALALGAAVLVRPIALYAIPCFSLFAASFSGPGLYRRLRAAAIVLVCGLLLPAGWMHRNYRLGEGFLISTIEGVNLLYYKAGPVQAQVDGVSWTEGNARLTAELERRGVRTKLWDGEMSRQSKRLALEVFRAHPAALLRVIADGVVRFWAGPGNADLMILLGTVKLGHEARWPETGNAPLRAAGWLLGSLSWATHLTILAFAALGALTLARTARYRELALILGTLGLFTLLSAGPGAYARFRVPVEPLVAWLAAVGWCRE